MKKLTSAIASIALLGAITVSTVSAKDNEWVGIYKNDQTAPNGNRGGKIYGADANVTLTLGNDWTQDAHFTFDVTNGQIPDGGTVLVCNGDVEVARLINDNDPRHLVFQTNDNVQDELREDENLTFVDGKKFINASGGIVAGDLNCTDSHTLTIIPDKDKCVTVATSNGKDQSGTTDIPQMTTAASKTVASYREEIMISCTVPACVVDQARTSFVQSAKVSGVNFRYNDVNVIDLTVEQNSTEIGDNFNCYFGGCSDDADVDETTCSTIITVQNNITDHDITDYTLNTTVAGLDNVLVTSVKGLNINKSSENNITVTFTIPKNSDPIKLGTVTGQLTDVKVDTGSSVVDGLESTTNPIATIKDMGATEFTVTYMNPNSKCFAKITAAADTSLQAKVTDEHGNSVVVRFPDDIKAGETAFVFADAGGSHQYDLDALVDAAGGLPGNGWTVDFLVNAAVDVAAYMQTANGERTLTVLYPEYVGIADATPPVITGTDLFIGQ